MHQDFISFAEPMNFGKFEALGYFPYERAQVCNDVVAVTRTLFTHLIASIDIMDNKYVVIFRDKERFGTESFAIQVKDAFCKLGSWDQVVGYDGNELK